MKMILLAILCITFFDPTTSNVIREAGNETSHSNNQSVCTTSGCIKAAELVKNNLDESVEPCDDFFKFACGGFIKRNPVPNNKGAFSNFDIVIDRELEQLKEIFEEPSTSNEPKPFSDVKKFYKLCVDNKTIEEDGLKTIKGILQTLGGWPVLEGPGWNKHVFEWKDIVYKSRRIGLPHKSMIYVYVDINALDTSKLIITIDQSGPELNREYLIQGLDNKIVKAYYDYLVDLAVIFGADKSYAEEEIKDALDFEISLSKLGLSQEERVNATALTNPMTVEEMQQKFPSIPWQEFLENVAYDPTLQVLPSTVVMVSVPDYLTKLEKLLQQTSKRVQANFLLYRILISLVPYLNQELRDRKLQFSKVESGASEHIPKWSECVGLVTNKLRFAVGGLYLRRYFNEDAKKAAKELVTNLKNTFIEMLRQVDWMDEDTKKEALAKAVAMDSYVGYSSELLDDQILRDYYYQLNSTANNFLKFAMAVDKFIIDVDFQELQEPFNGSAWIHKQFVGNVDAYYNPLGNDIQFPAGILQNPFFSTDRPNYMNYGSIGFAIGHEITHGFDSMGSQYDKHGIAKNWWAKKTKQAFMDKVQCIIDQYSNFTAPEINKNLNGIVTSGENVADNGGIKEAYLAYEKWVKENGEEARLPNLKYSPRQLFWISTANMWCSNMKTEFLEQQISTNVHPPSRFRVLGSVSNSKFFSKDFECPIGSKMNPVHKCQVW
ncbi:hypothetical protein ILUMI_26457 [Ignelater luminosus]|uniref:Uncharacterized protein n=1 Tax=Ignelater luminosus TaxID=2038154 RepID=A0A8K0C6G8_IGNLU|nr:hypothetical protein ILUMI_26457 [Ignelater luminosus]